jgi:hypothetical protein
VLVERGRTERERGEMIDIDGQKDGRSYELTRFPGLGNSTTYHYLRR